MPRSSRCFRWLPGVAVCLALAGPCLPASLTSRDLALQGRRELESGSPEQARALLKEARETMARESRAEGPVSSELADHLALSLYNLGVRFNNEGDPRKAADCLVEVFRLEELVPRLRDAAFRSRLLEAILSVLTHLASLGDVELVRGHLKVVRPEEDPGADILTSLGEAHLAAGDLGEAESRFAQALLQRAGSPGASLGLGRVLLRRAEAAATEDAIELLGQAGAHISRACDAPQAPSGCRLEQARASLRLARRLQQAGELSRMAGSLEQAGIAFGQGARQDESDPWIRLEEGRFLIEMDRHDEAAGPLSRAASLLERLIADRPADVNAAAWRAALASCRENLAIAAYNLAVDAVNEARFDQVESLLSPACGLSEGWGRTCRALIDASRQRREAFMAIAAGHEKILSARPASAEALLALGDLYAAAGDYQRAMGYYRRLESLGPGLPGLVDRIADVRDPGRPQEQVRSIDVPQGRVGVRTFAPGPVADVDVAVKAAWLRVASALGEDALRGELTLTIFPNRRAFRESAGNRIGSTVKGAYSPGHVKVFDSPSRTLVDWVSVLTHEIGHHAVERLCRGQCPRWLSEGVARYVEGDSSILDRAHARSRLEAGRLPPLDQLDAVMARSWNDAETILDVRDEALLAVEEMARRRGPQVVRVLLQELGRRGMGRLGDAFSGVLGAGVSEIDDAWRQALQRTSASGLSSGRRNRSDQAPEIARSRPQARSSSSSFLAKQNRTS